MSKKYGEGAKEEKGDFRVVMLNGNLRLIDGGALLTKEEAAEAYRWPDKIQLLGENGWEYVKREVVGLPPIVH